MDPNNPNSNNPNDLNNPNTTANPTPVDPSAPTTPSGFSWPSTPGGGLSQPQSNPSVLPEVPIQNIVTSPPPIPVETPILPDQPIHLDINPQQRVPDLPPTSEFSTPPAPPPPPPVSEPANSWPSTPTPLNDPASLTQPPPMQQPPAPLDNLTPGITSQPSLSGTLDGAQTSPENPQITTPPIGEAFQKDAANQAMPQNLSQSLGLNAQQPQQNMQTPQIPNESAPTDLSHLISETTNGNSNHNEVYTPPVAQPENLVVPSNNTPESISASGSHINLSKILIIVGILVVLIVSGLSAYFILGIGKPAPEPASLPVQEESTLTNPPKQIATPSPIPLPSAAPATSSGLITPSPTGTSALDLLKQRQGNSAPSPTPSFPPIPNP